MNIPDPRELERYNKNCTRLNSQQFTDTYSDGEMLGQGTFGNVLRVRTKQGLEVALKHFNKNAVKSFKQIIREVDNLKQLINPYIVRFIDCYIVDDSEYYIVIEYCPGGSLTTHLKEHALNDYDRMVLCRDIAKGLAYAHQMCIVHRDLKPDNILIGRGGVAKICDLGCSTKLGEEGDVLSSRVGSPAYMDCRVTNCDSYDITVDIYSMGMIFVCIFKGKGLYDECTSEYSMEQKRNGINANFDALMDEILKGVPILMQIIIKNCLNVDHAKRHPAQAIVALIEKELSTSKSLLSKLMSTIDEEAIEDESSLFAMGLMTYCQRVDKKQAALSTREDLFKLLQSSRDNLAAITKLGPLKHVDPKTKKQFCAFLLFYYFHWLDSLQALLRGETSPLSTRYPKLKFKAIEKDVLENAERHIVEERAKFRSFFSSCYRSVASTVRLIDVKVYLPQGFKKVINKAAINLEFDYSEFEDGQLRKELWLFFEKRVQAEFWQNLGSGLDVPSSQQLKEVEEMVRSL